MERSYEALLIIDPAISEENLQAEQARLTGFFPEAKAACTNLGLKEFTYPIKRKNQGYYLALNFTADNQQKTELENSLRLNPVVLRYLVIRALRPKKETPAKTETA